MPFAPNSFLLKTVIPKLFFKLRLVVVPTPKLDVFCLVFVWDMMLVHTKPVTLQAQQLMGKKDSQGMSRFVAVAHWFSDFETPAFLIE